MSISMGPRGHQVRFRLARWLAIASAALLSLPAAAVNYPVNSTSDLPDANPGNGTCDATAGNLVCTLRAAVQEANANPNSTGTDSISLQGNTTYVLTRAGVDDSALNGDLDILDSVTLTTTGPNTVIDGNGAVTGDRVLHVSKCIGVMANGGENCPGGDVQVSMTGITIRQGRPASLGGGINNQGILSATGCTITSNGFTGNDRNGGGIYNGGLLTLTESTVSDNTTGANNANGGGIYNGAVLFVYRSAITGNSAVGGNDGLGYGGGIYNAGAVLVSDTTIHGNSARAQGGGIFTSAVSAKVERSTISGNTAVNGGGIYNFNTPLSVVNSTISGNFSRASGGGIVNGAGTTDVFNSTITLNLANSDESGSAIGGGVYNFSGTFNFVNTIVSVNESVLPTLPFPTLLPDDCAGVLTSQGNNIMSDVDASHCSVNGAYLLAFPNLGPLQDNGGPTLTHALPPGSPAIDAGSAGGCRDESNLVLADDQRGLPRPEGAACDIGAYERQDRLFQDGFET